MKKIIALLLCLCFVLALAACGGGNDEDASSEDEQSTVSQKSNVIDPDEEVFIIKTDYCDLKYPSKWEKKVKVDVASEKVRFTTADGKVKLFDLCFGGKDGYVYGTLTGDKPVELRVVIYDIDEKLKNFEECCVMQDNMNITLQYLVDEGKVTVN